MSPAVKEIKGLDSAIAEDEARLVEIGNTLSYNKRKRDLLAASLSEAEKAELNPPAAAGVSVGDSPTNLEV